MENKRSIGITVLGRAMLIYGFLLFTASGYIVVLPIIGSIISAIFHLLYLSHIFMFLQGIPLITGLAGIIYLICGFGILSLRNWARLTTIYLSTLLLIPSIYLVVTTIIAASKGELEGPAAMGYMAIFMVIPYIPFLAPLIYLTRPQVKEQFKYPILGVKILEKNNIILPIIIAFVCLAVFNYYKIVNHIDFRSSKTLVNTLRKGIVPETYSARMALIKRGKHAVPFLIDALKDENVNLRKSAADVLGSMRDVSAVEPLIALLEDKNLSVQEAAVWALGVIGDKRAIAPLTKLSLKEEDGRVRNFVIAIALERIKNHK